MFAWQRPMPARQVTQPAPAARSGGAGYRAGIECPCWPLPHVEDPSGRYARRSDFRD